MPKRTAATRLPVWEESLKRAESQLRREQVRSCTLVLRERLLSPVRCQTAHFSSGHQARNKRTAEVNLIARLDQVPAPKSVLVVLAVLSSQDGIRPCGMLKARGVAAISAPAACVRSHSAMFFEMLARARCVPGPALHPAGAASSKPKQGDEEWGRGAVHWPQGSLGPCFRVFLRMHAQDATVVMFLALCR